MRWLLIYRAKVLIAGAETSRDFGCCPMAISRSSTRRHFVFGQLFTSAFCLFSSAL
jgi:hypothetical protein